MPNSVERALADSFSLDHPDVPWSPPEVPPPTADLRAALQILEAQASAATPKHVAWCLAKLMMAFEPTTKLSGEETKLRAAVWLEACGDLGDALWSKATLAAIQSSKWMPKPAEFRKFVEREVEDRTKRLKRCRAMLDGTRAKASAGPFVQDPEDVRLRTLRDSYRKIGQTWKAAGFERKLAVIEGRGIEDWAAIAEPETPAEKSTAPELPAIGPEVQARTFLGLAKTWRKQGNKVRADALEAKARELAPQLFEPAPEMRDIPEAMEAS